MSVGTSASISIVGDPGSFTLLGRGRTSASTQTAGQALEWARDLLASGADIAALIDTAQHAAMDDDGPIFLPYLAGERAPLNQPDLRAAFAGLALHHCRDQLLRAVIESVAFSTRHVLEELTAGAAGITRVRTVGALTGNPFWRTTLANLLGCEVEMPECGEAVTLGAAMLAAVAIGTVADGAAAARDLTRIGNCARPVDDPPLQRRYTAYRRHQRKLSEQTT